MDTDDKENKSFRPGQNKADPKRVRIKIRPGRAIADLGNAGETVVVSEQEADRIVAMGYADRLED